MTRILIVEDEESWSDALSYMLRREGFDVAVADTGPMALLEFDRNGADLVLLDLMLPQMSGVDVCRELRARRHVPIIMVSARDSEVDKVVGLEIGADDYVTKPYSVRELIARVRAVLRRRSRRVPSPELDRLAAGPGDRPRSRLQVPVVTGSVLHGPLPRTRVGSVTAPRLLGVRPAEKG